MGGSKQQTPNLIGIRVEPLQSRIGASKYIKSDWTMEAFVLPRSSLGLTFADKELQYNSIYFLFGYDGPTEKVYVGQAKKRNGGGSILLRLREHDKSTTEPYRDIWQYAIVITSINDDWGPTELNNLEHLFYQEIPAKNNLNGNNPNFGGIDQDTDYSEKIRQAKAYIKAIGLQIFDDTEDTEKIQVESVINDYSTVEDLQNGMARIPEIITPHKVVKNMIDMLPKELFNPDTTFLDLACKGGEYLQELYDRLMETESLIAKYPDEFERSNHILGKQLFGIALSQVSLDRTTKNLKGYGHNIKIIPNYIGYIKDKKDKTEQFKTIINRELGRMKFDAIIGNPPYNNDDGGGKINNSSSPIYSDFVSKGIAVTNRYISMIIPSRWLSGGKLVLDKFRTDLIESKHLKSIYYYSNPKEVFNGIDIAGGVLYFLFDKGETYDTVNFYRCSNGNKTLEKRDLSKYTYFDSNGKQQYMVLTDEYADSIISKIENAGDKLGIRIQYDPFGFLADFEDSYLDFPGCVKVVCSGGRETYTSRDNVGNSINKIDKYKVIVGKVTGFTDSKQNKGEGHPIINVPRIINPGEVCTITYFVIGATDTLEEAQNLLSLVKTKFFRYLVMITIGGMNLSQRNFRFIPQISDLSHFWTDEQLYQRYNLTQEEIDYIESTIKPMN